MIIRRLSNRRYLFTAFWAFLFCAMIVATAAILGRASINLQAALSNKPDIAIYLLLPDEELGETKLLREEGNTRHYYAETRDGPKLVILEKAEEEWRVKTLETLRD